MTSIRSLLDALGEDDPEAVQRLAAKHDVAVADLARFYRGDHERLVGDLRKHDLVKLLRREWPIGGQGYYVESPGRYARDALAKVALDWFRDGIVGVGARDEQDDESDHDDWSEEDEDDDVVVEDEDSYTSERYKEGLNKALEYNDEEARKGPNGRFAYQKEAVDKLMAALLARSSEPHTLQLATGGGKTRVANDLITRWLEQRGGPVLWITKDWRLLKQAAIDLRRRNRDFPIGRHGGKGGPLHPLPDGKRTQKVIYSTIQTLIPRISDGTVTRHRLLSRGLGLLPTGARRLLGVDDALLKLKPTLVVWDEFHWGRRGKAKKILQACEKLRTPLLGLTATPRVGGKDPVFTRTFDRLVAEKVLAEPIVTIVDTGVLWAPECAKNRDFAPSSLRELGHSKGRNETIVKHYRRNVAKYGKTIVFACNTDHADELADLFAAGGVEAWAVHNKRPNPQRTLDAFKEATGACVLVNVEMLTHGYDVPDTRTVFLCRPTTSDILFAQMVGRASRRDDKTGKTQFHLVDFTVTLQSPKMRAALYTPKKFFEGAGASARVASVTRAPMEVRRKGHSFDPVGHPRWVPDADALPESVRGLWYREGQTFGIEFELASTTGEKLVCDDRWKRTAEALRQRLAAALPDRVAAAVIEGYEGSEGDKNCRLWNVEFDSSAGWEVTSRILANREGFIEVDAACRAIESAAEELGLHVNATCGTHVHLGWLGSLNGSVDLVKRAIRLVRLFESALATLVAPSRVVAFEGGRYKVDVPNPYCGPVSTVFSDSVLESVRSFDDIRRITSAENARYVTFNLRPIEHLQTAEVRMHNGTLEARKILLWVSLWQQILWAAEHGTPAAHYPDVPVITPNNDIVEFARHYLPEAGQPQQAKFLQRLGERRAEIAQQWERSPELQHWLRFSEAWKTHPKGSVHSAG